MNFAVEWQVKAMRDGEDGMGDHDDLPIFRDKMQSRRLHEQSQPGHQLDEVIEDIRRHMLKSAETTNKGKPSRRETVAAEQRKQQQQQQRDAAEEHLQRVVWDPGGFQQPGWRAHEQELMNFS
jgi:hypothetical protein